MFGYILRSLPVLALVAAHAQPVEALVFDNDVMRISQEASDTFALFVNGHKVRTIEGTASNEFSATFSQAELSQLLLANNNLSETQAAMAMFTTILPRDLRRSFRGEIHNGQVILTFSRAAVATSKNGKASFKYEGARGRDRNFVDFEFEPAEKDSRGGRGAFHNDQLVIEKDGNSFNLIANEVLLYSFQDDGSDEIQFQISQKSFKEMFLANNGVTGRFLGEDTDLFQFLAKGNHRFLDVTFGEDLIDFTLDREFVLGGMTGESSFKYNAGGKHARNFVNFIGRVVDASPSS